jgi:hypothetical protein
MSVDTLSETRTFDRGLEYAKDAIVPGIVQNAIDALPGVSIFTGRLAEIMFGSVGQNGRGKRVQTGGSSIERKLRLGVNTTRKAMTGGWDQVDTAPSDTVRHARTNWKIYTATINLSKHELRKASGDSAVANMLQEETQDAVSSLVDLIGAHIFNAGGVASRLTDLDTIISANDTVAGLAGGTYTAFNSRGVSARGTAVASISFTGGSFATTGIANWRLAWNNAWEGSMQPQVLLTTHAIYAYYEGSLQPQERFNSPRMADGGFQVLQFKAAPIFPDPNATSGVTYFLNLDHLFMNVLAGADFTVGQFIEPEKQDVLVAKVVFEGNLDTDMRKAQNKVTTQTA